MGSRVRKVARARSGSLRWVVDPIDGTANFMRGSKRFCVSLGCLDGDTPVIGVIVAPALGETFAARAGAGATLNGAPIRAAETTELARATVELGWSHRRPREAFMALADRIIAAGAMPRLGGSGALGLADVAAGRTDAYVELHINLWDVAAALAILAEAGPRSVRSWPAMARHGQSDPRLLLLASPLHCPPSRRSRFDTAHARGAFLADGEPGRQDRSCTLWKAFASSRSNTRWRRRSAPGTWPTSVPTSSRSSGPGEGDFARSYDSFVHGQASFFVWLNRGKRSVTLDLKHADAAKVLERLIGGADVLLQNLAPGAAARLGLSHADLAPRHPKLVVCDISGYGESGPFAQKKAYDLLIQAESGLISVTGTQETPSRVGISAADIATGMYALSGILAALVRRGRTGEGANVKIAMLDALAEWMMYPMYRYAYGKSPTPRLAHQPSALAPMARIRPRTAR